MIMMRLWSGALPAKEGENAYAGGLCRRRCGIGGRTVASRLSETGASVILLEAGPSDWYPWIHIPAGMRKLLRNPLVNWNYTTEPEKSSGERRIDWPRGRTLGGSSSINGMLYVRGAPADFDGWAQMGCRGWSYDDVLPFFTKSEHYAQGGDPEVRGQDGPLKVEDYRTILPLTHRFVEGGAAGGLPVQSRPQRQAALRRRLFADDAARPLARLDGADLPARGAQAAEPAGRDRRAGRQAACSRASAASASSSCAAATSPRCKANREVIVSGGTVNSPHILQISGIGPAAHLQIARHSRACTTCPASAPT